MYDIPLRYGFLLLKSRPAPAPGPFQSSPCRRRERLPSPDMGTFEMNVYMVQPNSRFPDHVSHP